MVRANRTPPWSEWLRAVHPTTTWTLSVGTGSSYLAAAGALDGAAAATHWASAQRLTDAGVTYSARAGRAGREGADLAPAASAGIDLALTLLGLSHGPAVAQAVQLALRVRPPTPLRRRLPGEGARRHRRAREFLLRTKVQLMSPTQNLLLDTPTPRSRATSHPGPTAPAPGRRRRIEVVAGIGLVAAWAVSGFLLELGFVEVVLLGVLLLAAFQTLVRRRPAADAARS